MKYNPQEIGKRIKEVRNTMGLSQENFAEKLNITRAHLGKIELGTKNPSIDLLIDIAELADVYLDYLILGRSNIDSRCIKSGMREVIEMLTDLERLV